jgi:hypothetical protein
MNDFGLDLAAIGNGAHPRLAAHTPPFRRRRDPDAMAGLILTAMRLYGASLLDKFSISESREPSWSNPETGRVSAENHLVGRHTSAAQDRGVTRPIGPLVDTAATLPEVLEPVRRQRGVGRGTGDRPVAEPSLDGPGVMPLVGKGVAAGMAEHVWMRPQSEACDS